MRKATWEEDSWKFYCYPIFITPLGMTVHAILGWPDEMFLAWTLWPIVWLGAWLIIAAGCGWISQPR